MKEKIVGLIFFLILTFFAGKVYAQEDGLTSIMSQNKIRTCLSADPTVTRPQRPCNEEEQEEGLESCKRNMAGLAMVTAMGLTGSCDAPNGCEIWYVGNGGGFTKVVNHVAAGPVNIIVTGIFERHVSHKFYAIGDAAIVTELGKGGLEAENRTQQIGQVSNFEFSQIQESDQKCVGAYWDPFGRVFDAVSLEPISGVNVSLFQSPSRRLALLPTNPTLTDKAGIYNILVDTEDDYYLNVTVPATHSFTENVDLNPRYGLVYSHIYSPGEVFHEKSLPQSIPEDFDFGPYHHDIPLQPKEEPYRQAVAEVIEDSLDQADMGIFVNYSGRVTFPMAQVCLVGKTSGVVDCVNADKYGNFRLNVDKLLIPQEFMEIKVKKVNLTGLSQEKSLLDKVMSFFVNKVNAQASIRIEEPIATPKPVGFNPILSYIEGYAYDKTGATIPNAKIAVKLKANKEIFYQTTADENGFFMIYLNHLPFFEYYFDITAPNGITVTQTTSDFITLNQDYLAEQNLNLVKSTRGGKPIINPETGRENIIINTPIPTILPQQPAGSNNQIIAIAILLLFLIVASAGIVFYMMKRRG